MEVNRIKLWEQDQEVAQEEVVDLASSLLTAQRVIYTLRYKVMIVAQSQKQRRK